MNADQFGWRHLDIIDPPVVVSAEDLWTPVAPASPDRVDADTIEADVVVIGTGAGGSTAAWAMRDSGARVLVLEMGDWLPREPQNWDAEASFLNRRYKSQEDWVDNATGETFHPGLHDYVGGNTKVFGAAFPRFRESDFEAVEHADGISPAWPIRYAELEPYYGQAEEIYGVHGDDTLDPTAPHRNKPLPFPPLGHEPYMAEIVGRMQAAGLHPSPIPLGVDRRPGGRCIRCQTCDGYPCQIDAKNDAEVAALRPALATGSTRLLRGTRVERIDVSAPGTGAPLRVTGVSCIQRGRRLIVRAPKVIVACGSVRTALLLHQSTGAGFENGLGNHSDQVGRNYMQHVHTALVAVDPRRKNDIVFQKTVQMNDWYLEGPDESGLPWGNIQNLGKLQWAHMKVGRPRAPRSVLRKFAVHSVEWYLMSEDLPLPEHRVRMRSDGRIGVTWKPTNMRTHQLMVKEFTRKMRACGFPLVFSDTFGIDTNSHQCGTARMGDDPATSVANPVGQVHGTEGLWLGDSSVFVSSAACNPALTIAALTLRTIAEGGVLA